ncbi:SDR family oxidoreductase [Jannaschia aquimarina]|uniref:GdhI protein n=1 Tax=Jannaschia aquimarina TaxID=935700 RepID=A0A0D1D9Y1_9RHOB|nr:SDR family NAD(P)-dependent oxidoreductase [Jannaschia aquimarina]KIT16698.1 Glucose 1-dehydrogenase 1 [Jannaschia aquimarina]SNS54797.1 NADP-dependent 3-hydroxy acid dehydrogenase YdfG [Jannaschia aquimarina]
MQGRTVMITGASRGIGAAAARAFAAEGANVALLARSTEAIADLAGEIGETALAIPCDVTRYHEMALAVGAARDRFGGLDVMILNAGVIDPIAPLGRADPDAWDRGIDVNLKGVHNGMHAAIPVLPEGGTLITVSSGAAHRPVEGWSQYCAAKAGAWMLTRQAHHELGRRLRVFGLSPGTVATQMQRDIKQSGIGPVAQLDWGDHIPPDWPAKALVWMCSPDADDLRGTEISLREDEIRKRIGLA